MSGEALCQPSESNLSSAHTHIQLISTQAVFKTHPVTSSMPWQVSWETSRLHHCPLKSSLHSLPLIVFKNSGANHVTSLLWAPHAPPHLHQDGLFSYVHLTSCYLSNSSNVSLSLTKLITHGNSLPWGLSTHVPSAGHAPARWQQSVSSVKTPCPAHVRHSTPPHSFLFALQPLFLLFSILCPTTFKNKLLNIGFAILLT